VRKNILPEKISCHIRFHNPDGYGVCKLNGRKVYIVNSIEGEDIVAIHAYKNYYYAIDIIKKSPHRNYNVCPHFPKCGGCNIIHIDYKKQLEIKQRVLEKIFSKEIISKIKPSPLIYHYRNKMEFTFGGKTKDVKLGLIERFSFYNVIDIYNCKLSPKEFNEILVIIKNYTNSRELEPYDKTKNTGFLRFLVLRKSFTENQIMLNIVTTNKKKINLKEINDIIENAGVKLNSVIWSINNKLSDIAYGEISAFLKSLYIEEQIMKYRFRIYVNNFFQTNTFQAINMLEFIRKNLEEGGKKAIDLYSGIGFFTIGLSDFFDEIIGIELDKNSVKTANENRQLNDTNNVEFINSAAEDINKHINERVDYLIVDPPRTGLHRKVIRWIAKYKPANIIYVSCNPLTASRDIRFIKRAGYDIKLIQPFDQFPHTPHIETISLISRKKF